MLCALDVRVVKWLAVRIAREMIEGEILAKALRFAQDDNVLRVHVHIRVRAAVELTDRLGRRSLRKQGRMQGIADLRIGQHTAGLRPGT